jgi:membrane peptidoglycan carboxypeptidase
VAPHAPGAFQVHNDEGDPANPVVDLVRATQMSYNTVYVPLGYKAGTQNVDELAKKAGLPADAMAPHLGQSGFFLGQSSMSPLDQATGYATIANDGEWIRPHTIRKVLDSQSHPYQQAKWKNVDRHRAFAPDVAHDVQYAMQAVLKAPGTGFRAALAGREVAGKTGTTNENKAAWFNGFTPKQLVTSVGMWRFDDAVTTGRHKHPARAYTPMKNIGGLSRVNGGDFPAQIWHDYMTSALEGRQVTTFPPPSWVGNPELYATPKPTPTPTPSVTPTPTCQQGQNPFQDHCTPDPSQNNPRKFCRNHPNAPQCQQSPGPPTPGDNCRPPVTFGCTTPPTNPGDNPNDGNQVQKEAARPLDE